MEILDNIALLAVSFFLLAKGADFFVDGASEVAAKLKIPQIIIGLTIVAMGTSAPEAAVSISAALEGNASITIGNIVGSNIFNILFIVGLSSVITPVPFEKKFLIDAAIALAAGVILWVPCLSKKSIGRATGIIMLGAYCAYFIYLIFMQ